MTNIEFGLLATTKGYMEVHQDKLEELSSNELTKCLTGDDSLIYCSAAAHTFFKYLAEKSKMYSDKGQEFCLKLGGIK